MKLSIGLTSALSVLVAAGPLGDRLAMREEKSAANGGLHALAGLEKRESVGEIDIADSVHFEYTHNLDKILPTLGLKDRGLEKRQSVGKIADDTLRDFFGNVVPTLSSTVAGVPLGPNVDEKLRGSFDKVVPPASSTVAGLGRRGPLRLEFGDDDPNSFFEVQLVADLPDGSPTVLSNLQGRATLGSGQTDRIADVPDVFDLKDRGLEKRQAVGNNAGRPRGKFGLSTSPTIDPAAFKNLPGGDGLASVLRPENLPIADKVDIFRLKDRGLEKRQSVGTKPALEGITAGIELSWIVVDGMLVGKPDTSSPLGSG